MELDLFQDVMETLLFFKLSGCTFRGRNSTTSIFVSQWGSTFKEKNLLPRSKFFCLRVDPILEGVPNLLNANRKLVNIIIPL